MVKLIKTNSKNTDFSFLVKQLNAYLKITDGNEHNFYNQYNSISNLNHVVVAYLGNNAVGCGAFKPYNKNSVEIKRMFTLLKARQKGIATLVLNTLELWASTLNYTSIILETGSRQIEAVAFYKKNNYKVIENYDPYIGIKNSICFKKNIV